jgi:hypothetical protein
LKGMALKYCNCRLRSEVFSSMDSHLPYLLVQPDESVQFKSYWSIMHIWLQQCIIW